MEGKPPMDGESEWDIDFEGEKPAKDGESEWDADFEGEKPAKEGKGSKKGSKKGSMEVDSGSEDDFEGEFAQTRQDDDDVEEAGKPPKDGEQSGEGKKGCKKGE